MTRQDAERLRDLSRVLWGAQVWRVRLNIQHRFEVGASPEDLYSTQDLDEICLDFHKPMAIPEQIRKSLRVGSLWINVANCGVRLQDGAGTLLRSGDSTSRILAAFPTMIGNRLIDVEVANPGGDTRFVFDNDRTLTCFPANSTTSVNWIIAATDGDEIKLGPGVRISYETALR